jgi:hypothetical protein
MGRGPLYLSVELPANTDLTTIGVGRNDRVEESDYIVRVGESALSISLEAATLWEPKKEFNEILDESDIQKNLTELHKLVVHLGSHSTLFSLLEFTMLTFLDDSNDVSMNPVSQLALPHVMKLSEAIKQGNTPEISQSAYGLIGLGKSLNIQEIRYCEATQTIVSCIHNRTTKISEEFLLQAARGNASESVIDLFEALLTSNKVDLEYAAKRVMDFGGTSGIEMTIGILFGVNMMLDDALQKSDTF